MGTRSLTVMYDKESGNQELAVLYRQMDGYLSGHGQELKSFLEDMVVGNGISLGGGPEKFANGGYCLAAQVVAHFKDGAGGFYLHSAGTRNIGEEYIYHVYPSNDKPIRLVVEAHGSIIFDGTVNDLDCSMEAE